MNDLSVPKADTEKSKAILLAAEKLFSESGYHTTSVEEIAKAAGVSKGLVLYHFNSKANLLQHLMINNIQTVTKRVEAIIQTNMTARAKIRLTVVAYIELSNRRLNIIREAHLAGPADMDNNTHAYIHMLVEEEKLRLVHLIQNGIDSGEFRPIDSHVAANLLLGAIHELIAGSALGNKPLHVDQAADEVTSIFCDGIGV